MVLRGQPVGEQGAADRWTALDPYIAGSGAGAPRGIPLRGAPFLFPHIVQPRALRGPFFMGCILPCLQIGANGPRGRKDARLFCFAADPPGPPAGGPFETRPLPPAIGPPFRPLGPRALSLARWGDMRL